MTLRRGACLFLRFMITQIIREDNHGNYIFICLAPIAGIWYDNHKFYVKLYLNMEGDFMDYSLSLNDLSLLSPSRFALRAASQAEPPVSRPRQLEREQEQVKADALRGRGIRAVSGKPDTDTYECQTCKNRRYQDGSNDPGVSFKTPTRLSPERAAFAVRSHEMEHVARARMDAQREDAEIVSQTVTYRTGICPECGKTYIAGGTTRIVFRSTPNTYEAAPVTKGAYVDLLA